MTNADAHSTKLSIPKPRIATLPAAMAAATAITPSTLFHATVKYSSRKARPTDSGRKSGSEAVQPGPQPQDATELGLVRSIKSRRSPASEGLTESSDKPYAGALRFGDAGLACVCPEAGSSLDV